jgi:hypothetical protein
MLPSVFTVMRESNERIPSVCAAEGTAATKARKQAIKKFFMRLVDYNPQRRMAGRTKLLENQNSYAWAA